MRFVFQMLLLFVALLAPAGCQKVEIGGSSTCTAPTPASHPKATRYQAVLDEYVRQGMPGIALLIRDQYGEWFGAAGKADIENGVSMRTCTVSKAASITKTFVATLALLLVEEGLIGLDDPLEKWLPAEVVSKVNNVRGSTVRMLLNHTTGIADVIEDSGFYLSVLNNPPRKWKPEELITFAYGDPALFPVGTDVEYSNTNFLLLAMVLDKALGRNHGVVLREKIIRPLKLSDTYYYWHDDPLPSSTAQGYFDLYNNGTILNLTNYNTGSGNGYGGLYSTVYDLRTFIEALVRNKTLLKPATLAEMLTFTQPDEGYNRANGLGIFKDFLERAPDQFAYGHRGRDLGYTADLFWFPNQDYTLAYLINYGTDAKSELRPVFFNFRTAIVDAMMAP